LETCGTPRVDRRAPLSWHNPAQNLLKRTNNTTVETFAVNALNQLATIPNSTPTYDRRGNLTGRNFAAGVIWDYFYDHQNRLTNVVTDYYNTPEANRFKLDFAYDGQSRLRTATTYTWLSRTWYSGNEKRYLYDGMQIVQERSGNSPSAPYTRGRDLSGSLSGAGGIGGLLARSSGYSSGTGAWSTHDFYHADGNGNITAMVKLEEMGRIDKFWDSKTIQLNEDYFPRGPDGDLAAALKNLLAHEYIHTRQYSDVPNKAFWMTANALSIVGYTPAANVGTWLGGGE
jgi:YD repeat-containing protein